MVVVTGALASVVSAFDSATAAGRNKMKITGVTSLKSNAIEYMLPRLLEYPGAGRFAVMRSADGLRSGLV
jgi:hypothetical protein